MENETKKINDKTMLIAGSILILLVILITIVRSMDFSFLKGKSASNSATLTEQKAQENKVEYTTISSKDLQTKTLTHKEITLLDVRPFKEYSWEHIVDSVNVPLDEFPLDEKFNRAFETVVISDTLESPNTAEAIQKLREQNFTDIKVLAGGFQQWKNLAGATVSYGDPTSAVDQSKVNYISTQQVKDAIEKNSHIFIVDIRDNADYRKSHLRSAINIPFNELEKRRFEIITNSNSVFLVGINELQEFEAAVQVHDMLMTRTFVMKGAMPEWIKNNFPLEPVKQ